MTIVRTGAGLAAAAALFALTVVMPTAASANEDAKIHCYGVNTCKGSSDCKTASNECKGMNVCKGHGFKEMTAEACKTAGGRLTEK